MPLMVPHCSLRSLDNVWHKHNAELHRCDMFVLLTHGVYMVFIMVTHRDENPVGKQSMAAHA